MGEVGIEDYLSEGFWHSSDCTVVVNDRDPLAVKQAVSVRGFVEGYSPLCGHIMFATSGSTGSPKWVALSREALLVSAAAVNRHLSVSESDCWLLALPPFHVGGMGILARSYLAGCRCIVFSSKWNVHSYLSHIEKEEVTLSSLVPTQLVDIVQSELKAPVSLRAVLLGGGRLDDEVYTKALELGWPVIETYGMTETASQVATAKLGSRALHILDCWAVKNSSEASLMIKGRALMSGYLSCEKYCNYQPLDLDQGGWFTTNDLAVINSGLLTINGRADRCIKVLGELVNLDNVESEIARLNTTMKRFAVTAEYSLREGNVLNIYCQEEAVSQLESILAVYHLNCSPVARVKKIYVIDDFPLSSLGKIRYKDLLLVTCLRDISVSLFENRCNGSVSR